MTTIIIKNNICHIHNECDFAFIRILDNELSFKILGAEHTRAFKGYHDKTKDMWIKWDGLHRILTKDLTFPKGLLHKVIHIYSAYNKKFQLIDQTTSSPINSINILPKLTKINKSPRYYQLDTLNTVKNNDIGIIKLPTGSGKTITSALMISYFGKSTILYVIGKDLLYQTRDFFSQIFDQPIGIIGDGLCEIHDINIASVWTIGQALGLKKTNILIDVDNDEKQLNRTKYKHIRQMMASAKVHIFDECHLAACDTIQTIAKYINPEHIYGMSASPYRDDNADLLLESILGNRIIDISASQLINDGFLVKPIIKFLKIPKQPSLSNEKYKTIYQSYITENPDRNNKIINGTVSLTQQGFQTLVLYSKIKHGKYLFQNLSKLLPCMLLSGKDSNDIRNEAKEKLESGEIKCILASTIFDIGVDIPSLSGLIIGGGGKSSVRSLQRIGRVIRPYPGKQFAAILDFYDQAKFLKKHSIIRKNIYSTEKEFDVIWPT